MAHEAAGTPSADTLSDCAENTVRDPLHRHQTLVHIPGRAPRRIGVMGGTFDPIHHGHLVAASEVADRFELELVIFVPTGQPWQKADRVVSPAEDRYLMTVIATASNPRFTVSRVDIDRGGPTYTYDTLMDLRQQFPDSELFFITGADAITSIMSWRNWEDMLDLATFVGVTRPGYELSRELLPDSHRDCIKVVEIPAMAISSTDCRERASHERPVWYLVPDGVVQYIAKRQLYSPCGSDSSRDPAPHTDSSAENPGEQHEE